MRISRPLCVRPGCWSRGYHADDCDSVNCAGCQPRLALDGVDLCRRDVEAIAADAVTAAALRADLAKVLTGSGAPGEKTSGTADRGLKVNERAIEMRATIRHTLVSWVLLITEERGWSLPEDDSDRALAELIARSAIWLAAHPAAGEAANEFQDLVRNAHSIAYPSGTRVFEVAPCTVEGCPGTLRAVLRRVDSLLPSALVCDTDESHTIPADQWLTLGRKLRRAA
jgi:hypothetical protein